MRVCMSLCPPHPFHVRDKCSSTHAPTDPLAGVLIGRRWSFLPYIQSLLFLSPFLLYVFFVVAGICLAFFLSVFACLLACLLASPPGWVCVRVYVLEQWKAPVITPAYDAIYVGGEGQGRGIFALLSKEGRDAAPLTLRKGKQVGVCVWGVCVYVCVWCVCGVYVCTYVCMCVCVCVAVGCRSVWQFRRSGHCCVFSCACKDTSSHKQTSPTV
jgi:hypothetical protein